MYNVQDNGMYSSKTSCHDKVSGYKLWWLWKVMKVEILHELASNEMSCVHWKNSPGLFIRRRSWTAKVQPTMSGMQWNTLFLAKPSSI